MGYFAMARGLPFWYVVVAKPSWSPPAWLFVPVWTALFALGGWASILVMERGLRTARFALAFFAVQLLLAVVWDWALFAWQRPGLAGGLAVAWIGAIIVAWGLYFRISKKAALMLAPILPWALFLAALNFAILRLNR